MTNPWAKAFNQTYAEGGKARLPKGQKGIPSEESLNEEFANTKAALTGFTGIGDEPSVMYPEAQDTYNKAELASILSGLVGVPSAKTLVRDTSETIAPALRTLPKGMTVRELGGSPLDREALDEILKPWLKVGSSVTPEDRVIFSDMRRAVESYPDIRTRVMMANEEPVGAYQLVNKGDSRYIPNVAVAKQRQGVGTALMDHARSTREAPTSLYAMPGKEGFYRKQGMNEKIEDGLAKFSFAQGGSTNRGVLARYAESLPQRQAEAARKASVMSQPSTGERWQPEYEKEPPLEAPMISPDDLIGTGIPTKIAMMLKGAAPMIGALGVIKNKGGNWLSGSVEGALKGLKKGLIDNGQVMIEKGLLTPEQVRARPEWPINQWIDKPLTRYVKNEMATPEDPLRALAERGVLHYNVEPFTVEAGPATRRRRTELGFPAEGLAGEQGPIYPLANKWETATDSRLRAEPASTYQNFGSSNLNEDWINKLDPNTPFYRPNDNQLGADLGFNHLIDELSNAINPESGLPRHLQFPVDRLDKVSVPQAVERVDAINKWRAALQAEADQAKANNAATVLHKEYPENNPKGLKWVELKAEKKPTTAESSVDDMFDAEKYEKEQYQALQDALKYEGDTMGHCVGGYCDDVASGKSRIYSLRDAKGQPHVTVEVKPSATLTPEKRNAQLGFLQQRLIDEGKTPEEALSQASKIYPESEVQPKIVQIKGKGNLKPADEYQPFVQDFVKSGKWSDVGDLQNTGLIPMSGKRAEALGHYATDAELTRYLDQFPEQNFAHGGSVSPNKIETPEQLRAIILAIQSGR